jgi:hydroxyacylglutathione hydrolase
MDELTDFELHTQENWTNLAELTEIHTPLFEHTLFLFGYDYSSNSYLLKGEGEFCLIDPGNDYSAFIQLVDLGIKPTDIKKIALTHGHPDHAMGTFELFRGHRGFGTPDIEIFMHEAGPVEFQQLARQLGCRLTLLQGGETITLSGFDLQVMHTPGHTIDGLCFYHAPTQTLFSGDTIWPHAVAEVDDKAAGGRMDHYFYSVRTLRKLPISHVLPGHGGVAPKIGQWVVDETYAALIQKHVGLETPWLAGARELAGQGLLEEALFAVNQALDKAPEVPEALELKAFLLNDLGRPHEALAAFDQLLARQPDHLQALLGKGCALLGLERYEDSLPVFEAALAHNPQFKEAQIYKGMALYFLGRGEEALELPAFREEFTSRFQAELEKLAAKAPKEQKEP